METRSKMSRLICLFFVLFFGIELNSGAAGNQVHAESGYLGLHVHRADRGTIWPRIKFSGWRLWDANVAWPDLEPHRGEWRFDRLDHYVDLAKKNHISILLPLGLSPNWASARPDEGSGYRPGNAAQPRDIEDWRNYVRTVVSRYEGSVLEFEIWNEVNEKGFYSGSVNDLIKMTCEAYKIVKQVSPRNILVSPSMVGEIRGPDYLRKFLKGGGNKCIDVIGFHFYVPKGPPEAVVQLAQKVRAIADDAGCSNLPIWNTESGWWFERSDELPKIQDPDWLIRVKQKSAPGWITRSLLLGRHLKFERSFWYAWDNDEMGLLERGSGKLLSGGVAMQTLSAIFTAGDSVHCDVNNGNWVCGHSANNGRLLGYFIWTTFSTQVPISVPNGIKIRNIKYMNGDVKSFNEGDSFLSTDTPVYLSIE